MFTEGQRRVSDGSTVSCGPTPPLGHAEVLPYPLGIPQLQSHSLVLIRSAGCLRNLQRGGETWLHRPQQQEGKGRWPLDQPWEKDSEIMGDRTV